MEAISGIHPLDLGVALAASLANLLVIALFFGKLTRRKALENGLGAVLIALGVGLLAAAVLNLAWQRSWWLVALPLPFVAFCALDFVLDYWLHSNFRATRWVTPYLVLFFLGLIGLMGYAFATTRGLGFAALVTYFAALGMIWFTYTRVGHGT